MNYGNFYMLLLLIVTLMPYGMNGGIPIKFGFTWLLEICLCMPYVLLM